MNRVSRRNTSIVIVGFILSGVFGYFAFRDFPWDTLRNLALEIAPPFVALAGFFLLLSILLRAYRWKFFLPHGQEFSFPSLVCGISVGYFFGIIFPGRIGDLLRPGYFSKASNQPFHICFYSVVMERIFELVILLVIAMAVMKYNGLLGNILGDKSPVLYGIIFSGLIFLIFARNILTFAFRLAIRANLKFLAKPLGEVLTAFQGNFSYRRATIIILLSSVIFFVDGLVFVYTIEALRLPMTFVGKFTTMVVTSLGNLFPSAPAGVGVFHYFCQTSLSFFGVERDVGVSASVLIHALLFFLDFVIGIGLFVVFSGPVKLFRFMNGKLFSEI